MIYNLRSIDIMGNIVEFSLKDGPLQIGEDLFVLTNRTGTYPLYYSKVTKGCDTPGIFEGDIISYRGKELEVILLHGSFVAKNRELKLKYELKDIERNKPISNCYYREIQLPRQRRNFIYKTGNTLFSLSNIVGYFGGKLYINVKGGYAVDIETVKQSAGTKVNGNPAFYGENTILINGKLEEM